MKEKLSYILFSFSCLFVGVLFNNCNRDEKPKRFEIDFESLQTNQIFNIVLDIAVKGDTLLVNQFSERNFLNWVSLNTGDQLKSKISKGNGPGEMLGPLKTCVVNDSLIIYDRAAFNLYKSNFQCDSVIPEVNSLPFWTSKVFPLSNGINIVSKIPFGVNDEDVKNSRFAAMVKDSVICHFGIYPNFSNSDKKCDAEQKAHFHQTAGLCEIPNNRFVVASPHVLSLYSFKDNTFKLEKEVLMSPYEYSATPATKIMSASAKLEDGYDAGARNGLTYFNGKLFIPYKKEQSDNIYSILCYDTNLNLIGEIIPKTPIMDPITIDHNGRIIALTEDDSSTNISISKQSVDKIW